MTKRTVGLFVICWLSCSISACILGSEETTPETYTITLSWVFGTNNEDCFDAQVGEVQVALYQGQKELINDYVSCSDGGVNISDLENGNYSLELRGISNGGETFYGKTLDLSVSGQDKDLGTVQLDTKADIVFAWSFGAHNVGCSTALVDRVKVMLNDSSGTTNLFTANPIPDCEDGDFSQDKFVRLEYWDAGPNLEYELELIGICQSDLSEGYSKKVNLNVTDKGENNFGEVVLDAIGGCF